MVRLNIKLNFQANNDTITESIVTDDTNDDASVYYNRGKKISLIFFKTTKQLSIQGIKAAISDTPTSELSINENDRQSPMKSLKHHKRKSEDIKQNLASKWNQLLFNQRILNPLNFDAFIAVLNYI